METENMYIGSLAFGVTSCDPATVAVSSLPEDADMLLDRWQDIHLTISLNIPPYLHRPEYWVVTKDVAGGPRQGDELSFRLDTDGSVVSTLP